MRCSDLTGGAAAGDDRRILGVVLVVRSSPVAHLPMKHRFGDVCVLFLLIVDVEFVLDVVRVLLVVVSLDSRAPFDYFWCVI